MHGGQEENHLSPQAVTPLPRPLSIVADDLTGACDAAVAFTPVRDPVSVQIDGDPSNFTAIFAMTTESRDLRPKEAEARIRNIAERLPRGVELFKKIDSVFRGNTVVEIAATLRFACYDLAVLAPAYPALGRTVSGGVFHIADTAGDRILPIAELLASIGNPLTALPAGLSVEELAVILRGLNNPNPTNPKPVVLCDASNQDDLARVVSAARSLEKHILWIGSGGLAHALTAEFPSLQSEPTRHPRIGYAIFFIGSSDPVTCRQVEHLRRVTHIPEHRPDRPHASVSDLLIPVMLGQTTADDLRRAVATYDSTRTGCLFMTGGDTAHFVCRALGIGALRLQCEFAPGIPLAIAEGGPFDGVSVVLKSGGFGEPDLLCRLLEACRPEVPA